MPATRHFPFPSIVLALSLSLDCAAAKRKRKISIEHVNHVSTCDWHYLRQGFSLNAPWSHCIIFNNPISIHYRVNTHGKFCRHVKLKCKWSWRENCRRKKQKKHLQTTTLIKKSIGNYNYGVTCTFLALMKVWRLRIVPDRLNLTFPRTTHLTSIKL